MSVNATAPTFREPPAGNELVRRILLERLVDDLDEVGRIVWADRKTQAAAEHLDEYDHARIRGLADESMMIACSLLEAVMLETD